MPNITEAEYAELLEAKRQLDRKREHNTRYTSEWRQQNKDRQRANSRRQAQYVRAAGQELRALHPDEYKECLTEARLSEAANVSMSAVRILARRYPDEWSALLIEAHEP